MSKDKREVLSVSAGATFDLIKECYIYSCPDKPKKYAYREFDYITFRNKTPNSGEMDRLYKVEEVEKVKKILIFNPLIEAELNEKLSSNPDYRDRLIKYIDEVKKLNHKHLNKLNYVARFYILSKENTIELKHKPRPRRNNAGGWYYTKAELIDTKKEFVETC